jgi:hypothetical protein
MTVCTVTPAFSAMSSSRIWSNQSDCIAWAKASKNSFSRCFRGGGAGGLANWLKASTIRPGK